MQPKALIISLGLLVLFGCELDPIADVKPECQISALFTPSPVSCPAPCTVSINENSTVSSSCEATFQWDFGDGNFSEVESPGNYTYDDVGNYTLCLTIEESVDPTNTDSTCVTIVVFNPEEPPVAVIQTDVTNCFGPCTVSFRGDQSMQALNYLWDFDDGDTSVEPNVEHTFAPSHDPYNVSLTVTNTADDSIDAKTVQIFADWRTFNQDFLAQDLGIAWGVMPTSSGSYALIGTEQLAGGDFGVYSLLADPAGAPIGSSCVFTQLSDFDFVFESILLSNGEVAAVGSTVNDVNATNNDILYLNYNPLTTCTASADRIGDDNRREEGRALVEVSGPGGIGVAIAGEVRDGGDFYVYFRRFTVNGSASSSEQLSLIVGEGLLVTDLVEAPNGDYWVTGQTDPIGDDVGQALLVHLNASGAYLEHFTYGGADTDDRFRSLTINESGTHVLACGFSFSGFGPKEMIYLRADLNAPAGANIQEINTGKVQEARSIYALENGQLLIGGGGSDGCSLQLMTESGTVLLDESYGSSATDFFNIAVPTVDGGFTAAGVKGGKIYFVKTDDLLSI